MIKKYITYTLKTNRQLIMLLTVMFAVFVGILPTVTYSSSQANFDTIYEPIALLITVYLVSYKMFSKHYSKAAMDVYGSLPIRKEKLFVVDAMIGYAVIMIPFLLFSFISLAINGVFGDLSSYHYFIKILYVSMIGTTLYFINYCICSVMNSSRDAWIGLISYGTIIMYGSTLIDQVLNKLAIYATSSYEYGYTNPDYGILEYLIAFLDNNPVMRCILNFDVRITSETISWSAVQYQLVWLILAISIFCYTTIKMKKRCNEDISESPRSFFSYPFIISYGLIMCSFIGVFGGGYESIRVSITTLGITLIGYLVFIGFYRKKIFHWKTFAFFVIMMASGIVVREAVLLTNGLGTYNNYPEIEEVSNVYVASYIGNTVRYENISSDDYEKILDLMKTSLSNSKDFLRTGETAYYDTTVEFIIVKRDGTKARFSYPMDSEDISLIVYGLNELSDKGIIDENSVYTQEYFY